MSIEYKMGDSDFSQEAKTYGLCMQEIVFRIRVISKYWNDQPEGLLDKFHIEYVCLQFRMIFELVLLSSLVPHKKYYDEGRKAIGTLWRPGQIDGILSEINPDYYPVAMDYDPLTRRIVNSNDGYLSKQELLEGFEKCGDYLHAWNPYSKERNYQTAYDFFEKWAKGINKLLIRHIIKLKEPNRIYWVVLTFDEKNEVSISNMVILDTPS